MSILVGRQGTKENVSVFVCDAKDCSEAQLELAKAAVKRLKTLRHPGVVTYIDSAEVRLLCAAVLLPDIRWMFDR